MIKVSIDLSRQEKKIFQKYIQQNHSLQRDKTQRNYTISARVTSAIPNLPPSFLDRSRPLPTSITKRFQTRRGVGQPWFNSIILDSVIHPSSIHDPQFQTISRVPEEETRYPTEFPIFNQWIPSNLPIQLTSAIPDSINGGCRVAKRRRLGRSMNESRNEIPFES